MTPHRRRLLHLLVSVIVVALMVLFARHVNWHAAGAAARDADWRLLAVAALVNLVSLALKGVRWWVFLRPLGVRSLALVMRATFAGASLNNLLVAQGGEGARVMLVARATGVSSARVLAALALERALDAVSYLVLLVGAAWLLPLPEVIGRWRTAGSVVLAVVAVLLGALVIGSRDVVASSTDAARPVRDPLISATAWWVQRLRAWLRRFVAGVGEVVSAGRLSGGMVLSLGAWALQVATYQLVARAAHLPLPLAGSVAALLAVGISFLVRATPGNVGVFQVVYALTASAFGVAEGPAVAVAVLIQVVQVLPTFVVGTAMAPRLVERRGVAR
ncbi:MAG: hypothetical protein JWN53_2049 [Gemmatimonadetes bacterium]|nr:hypothetical protein [Gemmatimonadota bacterium]